MSNIDKQALRLTAEKAQEHGVFNMDMHSQTVLALLDELEPMALAHLNLNLLCDVYRTAYEEARHDGLVNWEAAASLTEENGDLKRKLEAAEKRIADLELDETQLIEERDSAENALADMYEAAMGNRPEWSNIFGYSDAIDDVAQHVSFLDIAAAADKGE